MALAILSSVSFLNLNLVWCSLKLYSTSLINSLNLKSLSCQISSLVLSLTHLFYKFFGTYSYFLPVTGSTHRFLNSSKIWSSSSSKIIHKLGLYLYYLIAVTYSTLLGNPSNIHPFYFATVLNTSVLTKLLIMSSGIAFFSIIA